MYYRSHASYAVLIRLSHSRAANDTNPDRDLNNDQRDGTFKRANFEMKGAASQTVIHATERALWNA